MRSRGGDLAAYVEREGIDAGNGDFWIRAAAAAAAAAERARKAIDAGRDAVAAKEAMSFLAPNRSLDPVRSPAFHVLEEAAIHLGLAASRIPFRLVMRSAGGAKRIVFGPDGRGGLGRIEPGTDEASMALAAAQATDKAANPYWTLASFRERAGRGMAVAQTVEHLAAILLDMAAQGHRKAFLKALRSKLGTWVVDLDGIVPATVRRRIFEALGEARTHFENPSQNDGRILVQEFTPFVREHRFLVVGDRVAASTPSDRGLCVLDADPRRILRPEVARLDRPASAPGGYDRGSASTETDRSLVARMAWGARDLALAMRRERAAGADDHAAADCHCIDMGETSDGRVLPIEVNTLPNCGLYALDYPRLVRAFERRLERLRSGKAVAPPLIPAPPRLDLDWDAMGKALSKVDPEDPDDPAHIPVSAVDGLVDAYVAACDGGRRIESALDFARKNAGAIEGYLRRLHPEFDAFRLERDRCFFDAWNHPVWREAWEAHLREAGRKAIEEARKRIGRTSFEKKTVSGVRSPVVVGQFLECDGEDVVAAFEALDARDWQLEPEDDWILGAKRKVIVKALVERDGIDWGRSALAWALSDPDGDLRRPMRFKPGTRVRLASACSLGRILNRPEDLGRLAGAYVAEGGT